MATTYELIASQTLASDTATVTFSSISAHFDDLLLVSSARSTRSGNLISGLALGLNGDTGSNYSFRRLRGDGSSVSSASDGSATTIDAGRLPAATATADTFGNYEIYIPNYAGSANKSVSITGIMETNGSTAYITATAGLWSDTSSISSVNLTDVNGANIKAGSSFYLYGITKA